MRVRDNYCGAGSRKQTGYVRPKWLCKTVLDFPVVWLCSIIRWTSRQFENCIWSIAARAQRLSAAAILFGRTQFNARWCRSLLFRLQHNGNLWMHLHEIVWLIAVSNVISQSTLSSAGKEKYGNVSRWFDHLQKNNSIRQNLPTINLSNALLHAWASGTHT